MVLAMGKLTFQNPQTNRQLPAAVSTVHLLELKDTVVQACMITSKNYDKAVREKGKGHGLGAPHNHVFATFVQALLEALGQKTDLIETPQYKGLMA